MNGSSGSYSCGHPQAFVDQRPKFDNAMRKRGRRKNQVIGRRGIIRPDKRYKAKFL